MLCVPDVGDETCLLLNETCIIRAGKLTLYGGHAHFYCGHHRGAISGTKEWYFKLVARNLKFGAPTLKTVARKFMVVARNLLPEAGRSMVSALKWLARNFKVMAQI